MKTSLKTIGLAALLTTSLGLTAFTSGCASTGTRESAGEYVDDSAITVKVKSAFVKDPVVKAIDVKVETYKGIVQLSGFVNSEAEKAQAERVATAVPGVTSVKNNIAVK